MLGQLTDNRVLYRCHKTVLEMLRDRGYEIGDDLIEENYEEFERRQLTKSSLNIIAMRPVPGRTTTAETDAAGNPAQMKEPIFVAFAQDDKLGQEVFKSLLEYMDRWSQDNRDNMLCSELLNSILVVKGTSTSIFKKVRLTNFWRLQLSTIFKVILTTICVFSVPCKLQSLSLRSFSAGRAFGEHHSPRAGS